MKVSERLRGRAKAFKLDADVVSKQYDTYGGSDKKAINRLRDRMTGYRVVADELLNLADELAREGL